MKLKERVPSTQDMFGWPREAGFISSVYSYSPDTQYSYRWYRQVCTSFFLHQTNQCLDIQVPVGLPLSFMGYGAVVPGGYGVSYNPTPDDIIFCICRYFHVWWLKISIIFYKHIYLPASIPVLKLAAEGLPLRFNNLYRSNKDIWGRGYALVLCWFVKLVRYVTSSCVVTNNLRELSELHWATFYCVSCIELCCLGCVSCIDPIVGSKSDHSTVGTLCHRAE